MARQKIIDTRAEKKKKPPAPPSAQDKNIGGPLPDKKESTNAPVLDKVENRNRHPSGKEEAHSAPNSLRAYPGLSRIREQTEKAFVEGMQWRFYSSRKGILKGNPPRKGDSP